MNPLYAIYHEALYRPLFNGLVYIYVALPVQDIGLAIIVLTLAIRLLFFPLLWKAQKAQRKMAHLQPKIKEIQEKFKNNKEMQGKALMEFYATHRINPFSGCAALLVQLPILLALFNVFQYGFDPAQLSLLYSFVPNPGVLGKEGFGFLDLSSGNLYLGAVAAVTQYIQTKLMLQYTPSPPPGKGKDFTQMLQWQSLYFFPLMILFWSYKLPAALSLYWTVLNLFGILQEMFANRFAKKQDPIPAKL